MFSLNILGQRLIKAGALMGSVGKNHVLQDGVARSEKAPRNPKRGRALWSKDGSAKL